MTTQCCVCRRYRVNKSWNRIAIVDSKLSHSYCPPCKDKVMKELAKNRKPELATR